MVSDLFIILGMVMMMWLCDVIVWCDAVYSVMFYVQPKTDCGGAGDNYKKYSRHQTNLHRALQPTMLLYKDCTLHSAKPFMQVGPCALGYVCMAEESGRLQHLSLRPDSAPQTTVREVADLPADCRTRRLAICKYTNKLQVSHRTSSLLFR